MRIWFAANIPPSPAGGVHRSMASLARGLSARGHETRLVLGASHPRSYHALWFPLILSARLLAAGRRRPDWIIARSFDGVACALVARIFRLRVRVVMHNHGWEEYVHDVERRLPGAIVAFPTTWRARAVRFPLLRWCLALCEYCMCGTVADLRWIARRRPRRRAKLAYVPNGVDIRDSCAWAGAVVAPVFLIEGPPTWKKNAEHACAVFDRISEGRPEARLCWVGSGSASLPEAARCVRRTGAITHCTHEPPENMARWYTACPYLISASRFEGGHSFAILEAMSFGVVVFASSIPSTAEFVRDGRTGFLISGTDVEDDARLIERAIGDPAALEGMRLRAFAASRRHRWDRQLDRLEGLLCR